ncbi:MAG: SDR family NAD(P)-dependent oxidoreductase [Acidimicrobiales bacterium]|nr:SDR family NAD(P)-dependent oxidoreductase [Acidimicrobiales bacterium]
MGDLDGKVAIVTGSSSGIGEAAARSLADAGASLVVNSSSSVEAGEKIAASLPTDSIYVQADISDEEQDRALIATTLDRFGKLDILVNNAGWTTRVDHADHEALTNDILFKTFEINVYGTWWLTRAAMPALRESEGCIVNVTSIAGLRPLGSSLAYGMAKAALNSFTEDLARYCGPVRANAVAPGLVATPWTEDWDDLHGGMEMINPMKRSATPEDCAQAIMACVTNTYMNGTIMKVDGGTTLVL